MLSAYLLIFEALAYLLTPSAPTTTSVGACITPYFSAREAFSSASTVLYPMFASASIRLGCRAVGAGLGGEKQHLAAGSARGGSVFTA